MNQNLNQDLNQSQNQDQEIKQDLKSRNPLLINLDKIAQNMVLYSEGAFNPELIPPMITIRSVVLSLGLNFQLNNQNLD